mmetsp:Transcript_14148/g.16108  ORF Transcript_14148/g.16108 Transcript_14148/m.16108 type:complete len:335 (+) Transcript_14148:171-1175(+)
MPAFGAGEKAASEGWLIHESFRPELSKRQLKLKPSKPICLNDFSPDEYATLCAAVEKHGHSWKTIARDRLTRQHIRRKFHKPFILAKAYSDLQIVVKIKMSKSWRFYPLCGYYVALTSEASRRRSAFDEQFRRSHTTKTSEVDYAELVYIGSGFNERVNTHLACNVSIMRSQIKSESVNCKRQLWVIGPILKTKKERECCAGWLLCSHRSDSHNKKDSSEMFFGVQDWYCYSHAAKSWIRTENDMNLSGIQAIIIKDGKHDPSASVSEFDLLEDKTLIRKVCNVALERKKLESKLAKLKMLQLQLEERVEDRDKLRLLMEKYGVSEYEMTVNIE